MITLLANVSNPAKIRYLIHKNHEDEEKKEAKKIKQEWNSGWVNMVFDNCSNFKLKKLN